MEGGRGEAPADRSPPSQADCGCGALPELAIRGGGEAELGQNERLYNQTQALLTDISLTSREIRGAQTGLIDRLLQGVLPSLPEAVEDAGVAPELRGAVVQSVSRTLREAASDALAPPQVIERPVSAEDERVIELLRTFPDRAEGARSLELLTKLSRAAQDELRARARYELARRRLGRPVGQWGDVEQTPALAELEDHALIERLDPPMGHDDRRDYVVLTDRGRRVARLLLGRGQPPDWLMVGFDHSAAPGATGGSRLGAYGVSGGVAVAGPRGRGGRSQGRQQTRTATGPSR